jgi:UDP-glucuronate 4-epimerase
MMTVLVTGAAGFIGFHVSRALLERGERVVGLDNLNSYYDVNLKHARLEQLQPYERFDFLELDLSDLEGLEAAFERFGFTHVINLAAQAGVRYSIEDPDAYLKSNLIGFHHLLERCRRYPVEHLVYASSGSVSGLNTYLPSSVSHTTGHPMSLYAATKRSNELCAHAYAHLYGLKTTGLRFFSVYGSWGRPDMALFLFAQKMLAGETIQLFNYGEMTRDWTHINDITAGVLAALDHPASPDPEWRGDQGVLERSSAPFRLYHLGRGKPCSLKGAVAMLEQALGVKAKIELAPMQPGDVRDTYAEIEAAERELGFAPSVDLEEGMKEFVQWYLDYHKNS